MQFSVIFALLAISGTYAQQDLIGVGASSHGILRGGLNVYPRSYALPYYGGAVNTNLEDIYSPYYSTYNRALLQTPDYILGNVQRPCEKNVITNIMPNILSNNVANNVPTAVTNNLPTLPAIQGTYPVWGPNVYGSAIGDYRL